MRIPIAMRFLILFCWIVVGLHAQTPQPEEQFALEMIPGEGKPASHFVLARTEKQANFFLTNTLLPLPPEEALSKVANLPCSLRLEYKEQDSTVSVVAFLGYICEGSPQPTGNIQSARERIGSYSLRLGQSAVLEEMRAFGVQPYTITLVSVVVAPSTVPTISKVPSVALQVAGEDRGYYIIKIDNLSAVAVMGLAVTRISGKERASLEVYDITDPVIAPGASHHFPLKNKPVHCSSADTTVSDPEPVVCPVVLAAAVFADGSHGGDPKISARLEANRILAGGPGRELQELVKKVAADPTLSDEQQIERVREEVEKLPGDSGQAALEQLRPRYGELSDEQWAEVKVFLSKRVQGQRQRLLEHLTKDAPSAGDATNGQSRSDWILHW